jgi:hypothetical protein
MEYERNLLRIRTLQMDLRVDAQSFEGGFVRASRDGANRLAFEVEEKVRANVRFHDPESPGFLIDAELERGSDGNLQTVEHDGRTWKFHHTDLVRDRTGHEERWLVFVPVL